MTLDPELNSSSTQRSTQPSGAYRSAQSAVLMLLMLPSLVDSRSIAVAPFRSASCRRRLSLGITAFAAR